MTTIERGTDLHVRKQISDALTALESATGAPADAQYVVAASNGTLTAERVLTDTATVTWDFGTAGQAKATATGGTSTIKRSVVLVLDGGGQAISTGIKADLRVPYAGTITGWEIVANASGSIVIDVWKDTYANFPPTVADTITGTEKPTLSSASKNQDLTLSTWTTSITAGDWLRFNVDSASTVTRVTLSIMVDASS